MEERRVKLRRHIQAARAWLLQADKSLEHENDVQGDLKLMLAKAELAQTREAHRSWLKKIFPPLTALVIAGAVMLSDQHVLSDEAPPVAALEAENEISLLEQTPTLQPDAPIEMSEAVSAPMVEPMVEPTYEPEFEQYEEAPIEYSTEDYSAADYSTENYSTEDYSATDYSTVDEYIEYYEPQPSSAVAEPVYVPEPAAVPNEDMQQLMLDAGQILRAK